MNNNRRDKMRHVIVDGVSVPIIGEYVEKSKMFIVTEVELVKFLTSKETSRYGLLPYSTMENRYIKNGESEFVFVYKNCHNLKSLVKIFNREKLRKIEEENKKK